MQRDKNSWSYAGAAGGLVTTSDVTIKAALGPSVCIVVTSIDITNSHQTTSTEVQLKAGSTIMWRGWAQAVGGGVAKEWVTDPLVWPPNTAVTVNEVTQTATAGVIVNAAGNSQIAQ